MVTSNKFGVYSYNDQHFLVLRLQPRVKFYHDETLQFHISLWYMMKFLLEMK